MSDVDLGPLVLWVLAGAVAVLSGVLTDWSRYDGRETRLPLWRFLARRGVAMPELAAKIGETGVAAAEMGCTLCALNGECRRRLRRRAGAPPADCPNARLFA